MTTPLLTTKLYIPPVRPDWVPRPRLIGRLNAGLQRKLTLLSAPAGFGKTTLLSGWAQQAALPVAWVSLDAGDSDPARFWSYVIAALQTIHPDIGDTALVALQPPQLPPMEPLLAGLINEIAHLSGSVALVLDDFHLVTGPLVHDALTFWLGNVPPQMHLVLSGRADPPWPLARLRARREMTELRTRDLRFTSQEAASFLNEVMKLDLSPEDVAALEARTEGWIVGLQMAALSMRGRKDVSDFVEAFRGSHRFILDYLVEEVLDRQSQAAQDFLLKTSILDRMTASLCSAVTGTEGGQAMLTQLEQANLFLVPLDDERRWYRYHHLFADLLRNRLQQTQPEQVPVLHRRASEWYEGNGQIVEAVGHALVAGDVEWIEHLVAGNALAMIYHGELATVAEWLDALPHELMRSRPWLSVAHAWVLAYAGQVEGIEPRLQDAAEVLAGPDEQIERLGLSRAEVQSIAGHITAIRAYVAALTGDTAQAVELARVALRRLPEADLTTRGVTSLMLGCALRSEADYAEAAQAFAQAMALSRATGESHPGLLVDVLWEQAVLQVAQGQLRDAMRTCEEALHLAQQYARRGGRPLPVAGYTYSLMSHVLREWNDLETALRYARQGIELCQQWGQADALAMGYIRLAGVLRAAGETAGALDALREAKQVGKDLHPWYRITAGAHAASIQLAQGDLAAATRWVQQSGLSPNDTLRTEYGISYLVLARILMAQGRLNETLGLLERLLEKTQAAGAMGSVVGILVLRALVLQEQGKDDPALAALDRALSLAEPEGYVRTFLREGAPMGALLRRAATQGIHLDYVTKLLAALDRETTHEGRPSPLVAPSLVEPLSERELEVLRLLTTHLSSAQIAQELVIAVSTVRTHIKHIYGKLDVHSRREAVARAQDLGLV